WVFLRSDSFLATFFLLYAIIMILCLSSKYSGWNFHLWDSLGLK
ncbi:3156_t:CDS:1, partial [Acaulospora morrowiae]